MLVGVSTKIENYINVDTPYNLMFIETRKKGKRKKYYLIHSYRVGDKVKRITRYLGSNLSKNKLEKLRQKAVKIILEQIKERNPLEFELSKKEIEDYKKFDSKIKIFHLQKLDWKKFTEDFTYNTNAIEGSIVKLIEVKKLLEKKDIPEDNDEVETVNVAEAVNYIRKFKEKLSVEFINKLHYLCFKKTKSFAGKLRNVEVFIRNNEGKIYHIGAPIKDVKKLIKELCEWYEKHKRKYPPLLLSALVHNQFEHIHPFQDGNGRVGRLLLNYVLLRHKYPPINIRLKDSKRYYECLKIYDKTKDIKPFLRFLINQYKKYYKK